MAKQVMSCGCAIWAPLVVGGKQRYERCLDHALGPSALILLERLGNSPHLIETIANTPEVAGELVGSTFVRHLALLLVMLSELRDGAQVDAERVVQLDDAKLLPAWAWGGDRGPRTLRGES